MELSSATRVLFDNIQTITVNSRNTVNQYYMCSFKTRKGSMFLWILRVFSGSPDKHMSKPYTTASRVHGAVCLVSC